MTNRPTVLFVCQHGAAKSVLAAADLERRAARRGLAISAAAAGTEPDDAISPVVLDLLAGQAPALSARRPRRVSRADVKGARRIVTFGIDPADLPGRPGRVERWDDVPALSEDPEGARAAIDRHLDALIDELARAAGTPSRPVGTP